MIPEAPQATEGAGHCTSFVCAPQILTDLSPFSRAEEVHLAPGFHELPLLSEKQSVDWGNSRKGWITAVMLQYV